MITEEQAKAIVRSVGKPTLEFAASIVAPLYWAQPGEDGTVCARNGTAFFLRTPEALFGVTAASGRRRAGWVARIVRRIREGAVVSARENSFITQLHKLMHNFVPNVSTVLPIEEPHPLA